jgi:hypothetical protein
MWKITATWKKLENGPEFKLPPGENFLQFLYRITPSVMDLEDDLKFIGSRTTDPAHNTSDDPEVLWTTTLSVTDDLIDQVYNYYEFVVIPKYSHLTSITIEKTKLE